MKLRAARARFAPVGLTAIAVALLSAAVGLVASPAASAGPQTKWYTATVGQATTTLASYVVYPANSSAQTLYLRIANDPASNQSFGSADIDLRYDWSWDPHSLVITTSNGVESGWSPVSGFDSNNNHLIHLRNNGTGSQYAIPANGWLTVQVAFTTPAGGIDTPALTVKQSNDFSDSSSHNSNGFGTRAVSPAIYVGAGPPTQLVYSTGPSDVQMTSTANGTHYMCPPVTVAVEDQDGNPVSWLPQTAVTLSSTGTPGLKLNGSTTLSANTSSGVATFGAGDTTSGCTAGLTATNQGTYALTATTTVAAGAGYAGGTFSTPAAGYNVYLTNCTGSTCNVDLPSGSQTNANVSGSNGPTSGDSPLLGFISTAVFASGCDPSISYRPEQTNVLLDGYDKSITLAWSKKVTNQDPRNGTPFWPVCIQGPYQVYVSNGTGGAKLRDATNGAMLVLCSTAGVQQRVSPANPGPDHACISSLYKNAASEHAVIWVPDQPGDPHMW